VVTEYKVYKQEFIRWKILSQAKTAFSMKAVKTGKLAAGPYQKDEEAHY
jgi:hypothetical protein